MIITFIGGKKLCLLCIIGVFGISLYLSLFSTDIARELWIIHGECSDSLNNTYAVLENAIYSCITLLQGSELLIFIGCAGYYLNWYEIFTSLCCQHNTSFPQELRKWIRTKCTQFIGRYCVEILSVAVYVLMMWLTVKISVIGYLRDKKYYNSTNSCKNDTSKYENLAIVYATMIEITLFLPNIVRIVVIVMFGSSKKYWKDSLKALHTQRYELVTDNEHVYSELERRRVILSRIYIHTGEKVRVICNALEAWFMVQYLVYLLLLILDLIHIIRPLYERSSKNIFDLIYTTLNINFDFFAFFLPYLMAVLCNKAHSDYYNTLLEIYQTANITNDFWEKKLEEWYEKCPCNIHIRDDFLKNKLKECYEKCLGRTNRYQNMANNDPDSENSNQESNELRDYVDNTFQDMRIPMSPENIYYAKSLQKIEKRNEFDFRPSFLGISIPISSPGYTFSVVLAFIAIMLNFSAVIV